jgi:hypothetical protein
MKIQEITPGGAALFAHSVQFALASDVPFPIMQKYFIDLATDCESCAILARDASGWTEEQFHLFLGRRKG